MTLRHSLPRNLLPQLPYFSISKMTLTGLTKVALKQRRWVKRTSGASNHLSGGTPLQSIHFGAFATGAHSRWLERLIYSFKMWMSRFKRKLNLAAENGVFQEYFFCSFVIFRYQKGSKFLCMICPPLIDLHFLIAE